MASDEECAEAAKRIKEFEDGKRKDDAAFARCVKRNKELETENDKLRQDCGMLARQRNAANFEKLKLQSRLDDAYKTFREPLASVRKRFKKEYEGAAEVLENPDAYPSDVWQQADWRAFVCGAGYPRGTPFKEAEK